MNKILPPGQVAEIRERADNASEGPWTTEQGFVGAKRRNFLRRGAGMDGVLFGTHCIEAEEAQYDLDCDFTAHARTDVPALCDSHEALRAERDRLRGVLRDVLDHVENPDVKRINNQCTLCHTYRREIRAALNPAPDGGGR